MVRQTGGWRRNFHLVSQALTASGGVQSQSLVVASEDTHGRLPHRVKRNASELCHEGREYKQCAGRYSLIHDPSIISPQMPLAPGKKLGPYEILAALGAIEFGKDWLTGLPSLGADPLAVPMMLVNPAVTGALGPAILVDGVESDALDAPLTSIRHVRVDNNPYSAEFSRPGRGRIEVTTMHSIKKRYHGILLNVFRNSALDARDPFATVRPLMQRDNTEAELEGPISPGGGGDRSGIGRLRLLAR